MTNENLGVIPQNWAVGQYSNLHLDYNVVRTAGKPSIRIDPHTAADTNTYCECDGPWLNCQPGDHIIGRVWIKTSPGTAGEAADVFSGARLGLDFDVPTGQNSYICIVGPDISTEEHIAMMVRFGTSEWTLKEWDIIVPDTLFTKCLMSFDPQSIPPAQISKFVIWIQMPHHAGSTAATTQAWFADAELYINPVPEPPPEEWTWELVNPHPEMGSTVPPAGTHPFYPGDPVTMEAFANGGYIFEAWTWSDGSHPETANPFTVTPTTPYYIYIAKFRRELHACFIATACGTNSLSLGVLRNFRDKCLPVPLTSVYYLLSPGLASLISNHRNVKLVGKKFWEWLANAMLEICKAA